ncbi:hypothetical protein RJ45_24920 [Photobacterium gaetbulicola]|uniref:Uncharacterized protein n=1 Tax=Photobacterium gaetbulicola TaxID=1295392 RepID=A0A0B9FRW8_9GAMM|nr:hypothetical protein RJ45_24920 [Photobacterium gaetbulicola]
MSRTIFILQPSRFLKLQLVITNITILISFIILAIGLGTPMGTLGGLIFAIASIYRIILGMYKFYKYEKKDL